MEKQNQFFNNQENKSLAQGSKILEYIERVKKGETIESFGDIPESWKREISNATENNKETNNKIEEGFEQEKITGLQNEIRSTLEKSSNKETVLVNLKKYLLSKVDERFTKEISRRVAKSNIEQANEKQLYSIALDQFYIDVRVGEEYDRKNPLFNFDVEEVTKNPNALIKRVQDENGWHFRIPHTATTANKTQSRISLNVWGNKKLIEKLDALAHAYGVYYKTPAQSDSWNERNDPVTIYINNPSLTTSQIEALQKDVVAQTKEYVRSNTGFGIYGDNIAPGVEFGPESSVVEIKALKEKALAISLALYEAFDEYLKREGKEKSSVGMNKAATMLLNLFS